PRRTRRTDLTRLLLQTDLTFVASRPLSFLSSFRSLPCRNCRVRWLTGHRTSLITRRGVETKCSRGRAKSEQGERQRQRLNLLPWPPVIRHDRSSAPRMTYHGASVRMTVTCLYRQIPWWSPCHKRGVQKFLIDVGLQHVHSLQTVNLLVGKNSVGF